MFVVPLATCAILSSTNGFQAVINDLLWGLVSECGNAGVLRIMTKVVTLSLTLEGRAICCRAFIYLD